ncbi:hypothetical protein [Paraglaciecola sp.]|uniref:hypothetical protein n=1 Tax=Paraglaciecola sp. TaxID=1920173 RepID=UPI003EFAB27D
MAILSFESIVSTEDLPRELVNVPEWGGDVYIATMTAADRDSYELSVANLQGGKMKPTMQNIRAKLVARCLVDEDGKRIFPEAKIEELGKKSAKVLDRLFDISSRINGINETDQVEIAKN